MKAFGLGILVGRFQMIHAGHEMMLNKALELCDEVGLFVGSAQESRTNKNPLTFEEREELLRALFGDTVKVYPLPDIGVGNNCKWGEYVLENVSRRFGRLPDLLISGRESRRSGWLEGETGKGVAELYIPKTVDISATAMREFLIGGDREAWKTYTSPALWDRYGELREIVLASKDNCDTRSI